MIWGIIIAFKVQEKTDRSVSIAIPEAKESKQWFCMYTLSKYA